MARCGPPTSSVGRASRSPTLAFSVALPADPVGPSRLQALRPPNPSRDRTPVALQYEHVPPPSGSVQSLTGPMRILRRIIPVTLGFRIYFRSMPPDSGVRARLQAVGLAWRTYGGSRFFADGAGRRKLHAISANPARTHDTTFIPPLRVQPYRECHRRTISGWRSRGIA
jgi:hypothetical protein